MVVHKVLFHVKTIPQILTHSHTHRCHVPERRVRLFQLRDTLSTASQGRVAIFSNTQDDNVELYHGPSKCQERAVSNTLEFAQMPQNWMERDELRTVPERKSAQNVLFYFFFPSPNMKQIQSQKESVLYKLCYLVLRNRKEMCEVTVRLKYSRGDAEVGVWLKPTFLATLKWQHQWSLCEQVIVDNSNR